MTTFPGFPIGTPRLPREATEAEIAMAREITAKHNPITRETCYREALYVIITTNDAFERGKRDREARAARRTEKMQEAVDRDGYEKGVGA